MNDPATVSGSWPALPLQLAPAPVRCVCECKTARCAGRGPDEGLVALLGAAKGVAHAVCAGGSALLRLNVRTHTVFCRR